MEHFAGDVSGTAVHLTTRSQNGAVKQHTVYRELRKEVEAKSLLLECCNTVAKSLEELQDPPSPGSFDYTSDCVAPYRQSHLLWSTFAL